MSQYKRLNVLPPGQYKILLDSKTETPALSVARCAVGENLLMKEFHTLSMVKTIIELDEDTYRVISVNGDGSESDVTFTGLSKWCQNLAAKTIEIANASAHRKK